MYFRKQYVEAIFKSKLNFGIENWGGISKATLKLIQNQVKIAAKIALGKEFYNKSDNQRLRQLSWLPVEDQIKYSTMTMAYNIFNFGIPEEMSSKNPMNKNGLRIQEQRKF